MDIKKTWMLMLIFLLVAAFVWGGFSVYFATTGVEINPNADAYTSTLVDKFNFDGFNDVVEKTKNLPVKPITFFNLVEGTN